MKRFSTTLLVWSICTSLLIAPTSIRAESVDDKLTQITPTFTPGAGEFIHGTGYGKILMRVMMFGAVPQQGIHYYPEGTDLLFAILYAGGYAEHTKLDGIKIRRRGQKDIISIDLQELMEDGEKVPKLMDGDVVDIPYNWRRDAATFSSVTGFLTAITTFTLAMVALSK
jgi:hypothetical protein